MITLRDFKIYMIGFISALLLALVSSLSSAGQQVVIASIITTLVEIMVVVMIGSVFLSIGISIFQKHRKELQK